MIFSSFFFLSRDICTYLKVLFFGVFIRIIQNYYTHINNVHLFCSYYNYYINILGNVPDLKHFNKWQLFRIDTRKTPQAREIVLELPIENGRTNYVHQFAQTENFLVIFGKFILINY